jgi:hypothetical protein
MTAIISDEPEKQPNSWWKIGLQLKNIDPDKSTAKFTRDYFDSLEAQFKSHSSIFLLSERKASYSNAEAIINKYENSHSSPSWKDLIQLDLSIIQLMTDNHLQLKVAELRQKVSAFPYAGCVEILMPLEKLKENNNEDLLRAEAVQLATRLWQIRKVRYEREWQLKTLITTQAAVAAFIFLAVFVLVLIDHFYRETGFSFLPVLFGFGVAGALMSVLRRLQQAINIDSESELSKEFSALKNEGERLWISLLTGGVFSIIFYFLFSSGVVGNLISDTLIPAFQCNGKNCCDSLRGDNFLIVNLPATARDFAKCVVWSFLAGFSEQLVPDVLDRLSKQKK